MEEQKRKKLIEISIKDIENYSFEIPEYQRGYRWEEKHVSKLLADIYKASQDGKKYHLQPIIVKKIEENSFILIDGQQRLTTINMILKYNNNDCYSITYNYVKDKNGKPIKIEKKINEYKEKNMKKENLNDYYYENSLNIIDNFFKNDKRKSLCDYIKNNVLIMWYELPSNSKNEIKTFLKINSGKIELTQADLIKALFISKDKSNTIGKEWNEIERRINNSEFWYFISNKVTEDRMTDFLKLITRKYKENEVYDYFEDRVTEDNVTNVWNEEIKKYYEKLEEWYKDDEIYNLVGYIVHNGKFKEIYDFLQDKKVENKIENKDELKENLILVISRMLKAELKIENNVKDEITKLEYVSGDDTKKKIQNILLLYNILKTNEQKENKRFPFNRYFVDRNKDKNEQNKESEITWGLEHIRSQQEKEDIDDEETYKKLKKYIYQIKPENEKAKEVYEEIKDIQWADFNNSENKTKIEEKIYSIINSGIELHKIGNLALLSNQMNSSNGNKMFDEKRENIIEKSQENYVPICTINAFLKSFAKYENKQFIEWDEIDYENYTEDILKTLEKILKEG